MTTRIVKQIVLTIVTSAAAFHAYAVAPGLYLGLMAGPATNNGSTQQAQVADSATTTTANPKSSQFGTRVFLGYKINQYVGVEGGFGFFSKINYDTKNVQTCSSVTERVRDIDIVAKGMFPLGDAFNVYGKGGVAFVYETISGALNPTGTTTCGKNRNETKAKPTVSLGASYDLSQNWVADVSWNRVMVSGPVNSVDFFALGISYHIVDKYCGQFLCD